MKRLVLALVLSLVTTFGVLAQKETPTPTPDEENGLPLLHRTELPEDYDNNWERVVAELQLLEMIPEDGELLFLEDMAFESLGGGGSADATYRNYIMGALISVREDGGDSAGVCTFITRGEMNRQGQILRATGVVITSDDEVYAIEQTGPNRQPRMTSIDTDGDPTFYNPIYIIVLVKDSTISVWADGIPMIEEWELENELPDGEFEDPVATVVNPEFGCVMTELWAYGF